MSDQSTLTFTDAVAMVIDNDRASYDRRQEIVQQNRGGELERVDVADALRDWLLTEVDDVVAIGGGETGTLLAKQMVSWAMGEVDWMALADSYLGDLED